MRYSRADLAVHFLPDLITLARDTTRSLTHRKFLVDKNGKVTGRYSSTTTPQALAADIEKLLGATGSAPPTPLVEQE